MKRRVIKGFTLLELLIVIGILAILSTTVVLVMNPLELLAQATDSKRIAELRNINSALSLYFINGGTSFGNANTVYVSLPDSSPTCASYNLPNLLSGWSYSCKTLQDFRKVDGNGWIPIDLSSISIGSPIAVFPVDSVNDQEYHYAYITGSGAWELTSRLKSVQYGFGGSRDAVAFDGGDDFSRYEQGTNLQMSPYSFEFSAFTTSTVNGQKPGWYRFNGNDNVSVLSDSESLNFLRVNGSNWYIWQENILFDPNVLYELKCRIR